jgi:protein-arginine kinase activator protein McsA
VVILVDEYRTSINCNKCHGYAENYYARSKFGCSHKYVFYASDIPSNRKMKLKNPSLLIPMEKRRFERSG